MPSVHLLNVSPGDCTVIKHGSGHVSVIDICDGNLEEETQKSLSEAATLERPKGNFGMCNHPTHPIPYIKNLTGSSKVFRFILTHPDMDHMDGFNALCDKIGIANYWDTGSRRDKPDFAGGPFLEEDWDRYVKVRDNKDDGTSSAKRQAGSRFAFANKTEDGNGGGDGLYILAPDAELVKDANMNDDINDGSYVVLYRSAGGRVVIPGDAHDKTWDYVTENYLSDVKNCSFMLAPHHGRDSSRSYDFLDKIKPKLTLIGCSPSKYIDYAQWSRRGLDYITSNQAGNVVLETQDGKLDVYIENESFAKAKGADTSKRNSQGYFYLQSVPETEES